MSRWIFILIFQFFALNIYANWFAGGVISVSNIGLDTFEIQLRVSVVCGTGFDDSTIYVNASSSCGQSFRYGLKRFKKPIDGGPDFHSSCHRKTNCTDANSTIQGYKDLWFKDTVLLKPSCKLWQISYKASNSRRHVDNAIDSNVFISTKLNTLDFPSNSSVSSNIGSLSNAVCASFPVSFNAGATDFDGDSLSYEFVCVKRDSVNCVSYRPGFSAIEPISGITIDSISGQMNFETLLLQSFALGLNVREYSSDSGVLKSETFIELHFTSEVCSNTPPQDTLGILNFQGDGIQGSKNLIEGLCVGDSFSFDVLAWDPERFLEDSLDTLLITSNIHGVLPGASFSINPISDSVHRVSIGWRVRETGVSSNVFFIQTSDDACPIPGFATSSYEIRTKSRLKTQFDRSICRGDTLRISATGGGAVNWDVLYGDTLISGTNFSCDSNCQRAKLWPQNTSLYAIQGDLNNGCNQRDTFKIVVADSFSVSIRDDFLYCFGEDSVDLWMRINPDSGTYRINWSNGADSIFTRAKLFHWSRNNYTVRVVSDSGCQRLGNVLALISFPDPKIVGPEKAIKNQGYWYKVEGIIGSTFDWELQGGRIDTAKEDSVFVIWADTILGNIGVVETDTAGCTNDRNWKEIQLLNLNAKETSLQSVRLFPNPANQIITLDAEIFIDEIRVVNILGELFLDRKLNDYRFSFNVSLFPPGIYFLQFKSNVAQKVLRFEKL